MTTRRWPYAFLAVALLLATACSGSDDNIGSGGQENPTTEQEDPPETTDPPVPDCPDNEVYEPETGDCEPFIPDCDSGYVYDETGDCIPEGQVSSSCPEGSYEGAFGSSDAEMLRLYNCMIPFLDNFLQYQYRGEVAPPTYLYVPTGGEIQACGITLDDMAYLFCGTETTAEVYIGLAQLYSFYNELGDAAPIGGFIHEGGHYIQWAFRLPIPQTNQDKISLENQADCIMGVWIAFAAAEGFLEYPDDVQDLDGLMAEIASAESDPNRDHGTLNERVESFGVGYNGGLAACEQFVPGYPITMVA